MHACANVVCMHILLYICVHYMNVYSCACVVCFMYISVYIRFCERVAAEGEMDVRGGERATVGVCVHMHAAILCAVMLCIHMSV